MYLHTPALEVGSWWRVDTASGSDTATTVYAHDGADAIPTALGTSGSTVRGNSPDGTARFWSATATLYCKRLTYQGATTGTVVTSTGGTPAAPGTTAPVDIATISTAVAALPTTYVKLLVTDATSTTLTGTLAAGHLSPVDCTVGPGIRTLPAASSVAVGTPTVAKKADTTTNTLTVQRAGSDLIFGTGAGSTSKTLTLSGEAVTFVSNGVDRWSVESSDTPSGAIAAGYAPIAATPVASSATSGTLTAGAEHNLTPTSAATWTLPTGVAATKLPTTVKNNGTATVTVARGGSDTINGGTTSVSIAATEWARFTSDGAGAWTQSGTAGQSGTYAPITSSTAYARLAAAPRGLANVRRLAPVTTRACGPISTLATATLGGTSRVFYPLVDQSATSATIMPVYGLFNGNADAASGNSATVAACVEDGSTLIPFTFGGSRQVTAAAGAIIIPDNPVAVGVTTATYSTGAGSGSVKGVWIRTYLNISSGNYPVNINLGIVSGEVNGESTSGGSDLTPPGSGSVTTGSGAGSFCFGPHVVLGPAKSHRLFAAVGDSITNGQNDTPSMFGYIDRAAMSTSIPIMKIGRPGDVASSFAASASRNRRGVLLDGVTDVLVAYGVNDVKNNNRTAVQVQTDLTSIYAYLAGIGARVHAVTISPSTTSTDAWATTGNQTASGASNTTDPTRLAAVNDWIRAKPANVYGVFDLADLVMSARNSGLWATSYTGDGLHPTNTTYQNVIAPGLASYLNTYKATTDWYVV